MMCSLPDMLTNLVSGLLLSKTGFKLVFVANKFVLTKNDMYVGNGYLNDVLFKMNVMTVVPKVVANINNNNASNYLVESSNIWHARLGYANYDTLRRLSNLDFLPKFEIDNNNKFEICVESKMTRPQFNSVD